MRESRNRVVQLRRFGGPDELEVVGAPLPAAEGKLVLCPDLPSRRDRVPPRREPVSTSVEATPPT